MPSLSEHLEAPEKRAEHLQPITQSGGSEIAASTKREPHTTSKIMGKKAPDHQEKSSQESFCFQALAGRKKIITKNR